MWGQSSHSDPKQKIAADFTLIDLDLTQKLLNLSLFLSDDDDDDDDDDD